MSEPAVPPMRGGRPAPRGHADSNPELRRAKARKIEFLLGGPGSIRGRDLLDLGSGAGFLAEYFAAAGAHVVAADRDPSTFVPSDIACLAIANDVLPFADGSFDIILLNHVIEHVGDRPEQDRMLAEIKRCLRPGGTLYLSAPNRYALIEPHYRLPLLGALPRGLADLLVRKIRGKPNYDCYPLGHTALQNLLAGHFVTIEDKSLAAFEYAARNEVSGISGKLLSAIPGRVAERALAVFPTFIFIARKSL